MNLVLKVNHLDIAPLFGRTLDCPVLTSILRWKLKTLTPWLFVRIPYAESLANICVGYGLP